MKATELKQLKERTYKATNTTNLQELKAWTLDKIAGKIDLRSPGCWLQIYTTATKQETITFVAPSESVQRFVSDRLNHVYAILSFDERRNIFTVLNAEGTKQLISAHVVTLIPAHLHS